MYMKRSWTIWLFLMTFIGIQHSHNQLKHTDAIRQLATGRTHITNTEATTAKIAATTTTQPTNRFNGISTTHKEVIGDVIVLEDEDNDNDGNNNANDYYGADDNNFTLTAYQPGITFSQASEDVDKKNVIKTKVLLQQQQEHLQEQHDDLYTRPNVYKFNDKEGGGGVQRRQLQDEGGFHDTDDVTKTLKQLHHQQQQQQHQQSPNNKQTVKYSKHKTNGGDTLAFDFKQNLQRLLNNSKGRDGRDERDGRDGRREDINTTLSTEQEYFNQQPNNYGNYAKISSTTTTTTTTMALLPTGSLGEYNTSPRPAASSSMLPHILKHSTPMERRHIVPEKLQYTHEINIKQGRLKGIRRTFHANTGLRDVDQYLGLPYAEAPVGSRRFMPPGTPLPWSGLRMAHHLPPVCPQRLPDVSKAGGLRLSKGRFLQWMRLLPYTKTESEDCLYLNVYVPSESDITAALFQRKFLYPVLVYIHGESFEWNTGNAYDGSVLASYGDVIVVTINYRLGVLGFMRPSLNKQTVANFGLLDQIAALHWIQENIGHFGGDKDSVTLMGHSTGAACVNYLMISPVASGLFHRAILMSGSATSDWAATNTSLQLTMQIAHGLNCPLNDDNEDMLTCLRQKSYQEILQVPTSLTQFSTSLGPIVDGHVIPDQPYKVMAQYTEHFSRYDLLFGITESESYHTLGAAMLEEGLRENERDNLLRFYMQSRFDIRPDLALAATLKKYSDMYTNPVKATKQEHRDIVLDILSDARVVGPLMQTGLFHTEVNRHNYMYVFGHNSFGGPHASLPHSIASEELPFIFGAPLATVGAFHGIQYNAQEKLLAEAVMSYWCNFIKTGNPKAPWKGTFINLHALEWDRYDLDWPEFNKRTQAYMNIGIPPSVGYKYRQIYINFWNKELPDELNQIANMQQQPHYHAQYQNTQIPRLMADNNEKHPHLGSEVITGHMNKFGLSDNGNEDPIRTLKFLLQEPQSSRDAGSTLAMEKAENIYNPPALGIGNNRPYVAQKDVEQQQSQQKEIQKLFYGNNGQGFSTTNVNGGGGDNGDNEIIYGIKHSSIKSASTMEDNKNNEEQVFGNVRQMEPEAAQGEQVAKSETTLHLLIGLIVVFIILNIIIYSTYLLQKKKKTKTMQRKLGGGGILSYDGATDDELKRSKPTTQHDGDESYIIDVLRKSNTYEAVKTDRSPMNGFKITRQLSCSTMDTHTKVCEWMDGKAMMSNSSVLPRRPGSYKSSKKSSSFSSLGGSGGSFGKPTQKVSVAVDATSQGRGNSVLQQEPIEMTKLKADGRNIIICQEVEVNDQELLTPQDVFGTSQYCLTRQHSTATEPCEAELRQPFHQYSRSDPVDICYNFQPGVASSGERNNMDETVTSFITPHCIHNANSLDINVTSRNELEEAAEKTPLTHEQQLSVIKRRKYPKVLPPLVTGENNGSDSPPMTQDLFTTYKRNSLPPHNFYKQPPIPPPRTIATLGRKPSLSRPSSNIISSSPLMLACDCTEEEEEPEITKNTLIVGTLTSNTGTECFYSTLQKKRPIKEMENYANEISNKSLNKQQDPLLYTVRNCCACGETKSKETTEHITERVYNIQAVDEKPTPAHRSSCHASAPTTPSVLTSNTPLMLYPSGSIGGTSANERGGSLQALYAQSKKSQIPRIVAAKPHNFSLTHTMHSSLTAKQNCSSCEKTQTKNADSNLRQISTTIMKTNSQQSLDTSATNIPLSTSNSSLSSRIPQLQRFSEETANSNNNYNNYFQPYTYQRPTNCNMICPRQLQLSIGRDKPLDTKGNSENVQQLPGQSTSVTLPTMSTMSRSTGTTFDFSVDNTISSWRASTSDDNFVSCKTNSAQTETTTTSTMLTSSSSSSISTTSSSSASSKGTVRTELKQK